VLLLCLSISLRADQNPLAQGSLQLALAAPNAQRELRAFVHDHPKAGALFAQFVTEQYELGYFNGDEDYNPNSRRAFFKLAGEALQVAERIEPENPDIQRGLARVDAFFARYRSAYDRLSRLIDFASSREFDGQELSDAYQTRGWIATRWVRSLRRRGAIHDPEGALKIMKRAQDDLARSSDFKDGFYLDKHGDRLVEQYCLDRDKLNAALTLVELELDLGVPAEAGRHLDRAELTRKRYLASAEASKPVFESASFGNKDLTEVEADDFKQRLDAARDRLRVFGAAQSARSNPNPPRSGAPHATPDKGSTAESLAATKL
jgi:hypothetical protein